MAVYKDKNRGTWYASVLYVDWTGKRCRKLKRGFATKKEAQVSLAYYRMQKKASSCGFGQNVRHTVNSALSWLFR